MLLLALLLLFPAYVAGSQPKFIQGLALELAEFFLSLQECFPLLALIFHLGVKLISDNGIGNDQMPVSKTKTSGVHLSIDICIVHRIDPDFFSRQCLPMLGHGRRRVLIKALKYALPFCARACFRFHDVTQAVQNLFNFLFLGDIQIIERMQLPAGLCSGARLGK